MKLIYIILSLIFLNGIYAKQNDTPKESQTSDLSGGNTNGDITDLPDITDNSVNSNYFTMDIDQDLVGLYESSQNSFFGNYFFQSYQSFAGNPNILDFLPKYTAIQCESTDLISETNSTIVKRPFHIAHYEEKNEILDWSNSNCWSCTGSQCRKISLADVQYFFKFNAQNLSNITVLDNFMKRYADFNFSGNKSFICMNFGYDLQYSGETLIEQNHAMVGAFEEIDTMEEGHEFQTQETGQEVEPEEFYESDTDEHDEEDDLIVGPTTVPFRFANRLYHFTRAYLAFTGRLDNMVSLMDSDQEIHTIERTHDVNRANELHYWINDVVNYGLLLRIQSQEVPHNIIDDYVCFGAVLETLLGYFYNTFNECFFNANIGDITPRINFLNLVSRLKNLNETVELIKNEVSIILP